MKAAPTLDEVFRHFVPLADAFRAGRGAKRNEADARNELSKLTSVVSAILHEPPRIPPKRLNDELQKIWKSAYQLREKLTPDRTTGRNGYNAVLEHVGYNGSGDIGGKEDQKANLLRRLSRDLDALINITSVKQMAPQKGGNPGNPRRERAIKECASYFYRWTGRKIVASDESHFNTFVSAIFSHLDQRHSTNTRGLIKKVLRELTSKSL
jgi:uncharacterized protein (UPF0297 family)